MSSATDGKPQSLDLYLPLLPLLADGASTRRVADAFNLSEDNAKWRIARVCSILGARNRAAAVSHAYRRRLLDLDTGQLTDTAHNMIRSYQP